MFLEIMSQIQFLEIKNWIFLIVSRIVFQFFDLRVDGGHPKVFLTFMGDKLKKIIQSFSQTIAKWW
jgi:hypothetical protein